MYETIINENIYNSFVNLFAEQQVKQIELLDFGIVLKKCYTPKISMLIHCMENIDIFNDEQKQNINAIINKYRYV